MLTEAQFKILKTVYLCSEQTLTQRALAAQTDMSLGKVNQTVSALTEAGLLAGGRVTDAGEEALAPYRVKNAVIMAAGMSTRFAPLSYEKPKALLRVKGELLIEREIRQLQEAGIRDITLVVGYMKEKMFYLAEKFGVDIVVNPDYYRYNNTSTRGRSPRQHLHLLLGRLLRRESLRAVCLPRLLRRGLRRGRNGGVLP